MSESLDGKQVNAQLDAGLSNVALLNASCQAVIEAEIGQVKSDWWERLNQELGAAETLVIHWRQSGTLYFGSEVVGAAGRGASAFLEGREPIETLFDSLSRSFDPAEKEQLVERFQALQQPTAAIAAKIGGYLRDLGAFQREMRDAQQKMEATVGEVQAAEAEIETTINSINQQIARLGEQAQQDREAVAEARSKRTAGILETIFGIVFADVTGGLSLVLAGIGVASIAEAEDEIGHLESLISGFQETISADQATLTTDQQIVATLGALTMSAKFVLTDLEDIQTTLDSLRAIWTAFEGELAGVIAKLEDAGDAADLAVGRAWYSSACGEWQVIAAHVGEISDLPVKTEKRQIGQGAGPASRSS